MYDADPMYDADRATSPRCGGPPSADVPTALCPRWLLSGTQRERTGNPPVSPSSLGRVCRKLTLVSAVALIGATLTGGLWFGNRRGPPPADAEAHSNFGAALQAKGKQEEA